MPRNSSVSQPRFFDRKLIRHVLETDTDTDTGLAQMLAQRRARKN